MKKMQNHFQDDFIVLYLPNSSLSLSAFGVVLNNKIFYLLGVHNSWISIMHGYSNAMIQCCSVHQTFNYVTTTQESVASGKCKEKIRGHQLAPMCIIENIYLQCNIRIGKYRKLKQVTRAVLFIQQLTPFYPS